MIFCYCLLLYPKLSLKLLKTFKSFCETLDPITRTAFSKCSNDIDGTYMIKSSINSRSNTYKKRLLRSRSIMRKVGFM